MGWNIGDQVKHPTKPNWGLGEIVEVLRDGKLRVFFPQAGMKLFQDAPLIRVSEASTAQSLVRAPKHRKATGIKRADRARIRSIQEYKRAFIDRFPDGFYDPAYLTEERNYKVEASQELNNLLSQERFARLIDSARNSEIACLALAVVNKTNLIFYRDEKPRLRDALKDSRALKQFCRSLFDLLYSSASFTKRFTAFTETLSDIGAAKWTIATCFAFLSQPDAHMFLKPTPTKRIAQACNVSLNYRSEPNWLTYESLLRLADHLAKELEDLKPRDRIDLQSFIWTVAR